MNFYLYQLLQKIDASNFSLLGNILEIINEEDNKILCRQSTLNEFKKIVFNLNGDNASGPDGLSCAFYQCCWDIVGNDIFKIVPEFFGGNYLPKFITLTNLVLLPKKD